MRVILIRHAEARVVEGGRDFDRLLSDDGLRQARAAGVAFRALGVRLAAILTSPLVRACQTAQELAAGLDPSPAVEIRESLACGAGPRAYFDELKAWGRGDVAMVGHMPDLARVAAVLLSAEPEISLTFQPSAACCIDIELSAPSGKLVWFHGPDRLAELANPGGRS